MFLKTVGAHHREGPVLSALTLPCCSHAETIIDSTLHKMCSPQIPVEKQSSYSLHRALNMILNGTMVFYKMGGTIIGKTVEEKYLGVTTNANLKVSEQFRIPAYKDNQIFGMIRRNVTYIKKMDVLQLCIKQ